MLRPSLIVARAAFNPARRVAFPFGCILSCLAGVALAQDPENARRGPALPPHHANVAYGSHPRHVLDVWLASAPAPTPVLIYFHGGGFMAGGKENLPTALLTAALRAGISVVAANYRLAPEVALPAPYLDGGRVVQFVRSRASEWKIDPRRVALTGSSAGAGISLWLAFHDDLAAPASSDPVARFSTRVACAVVSGAQPTYDPREIRRLAGEAAARHRALGVMFGLQPGTAGSTQAHRLYAETAPITHLTADDPPVFAYYSEARSPVPADARDGTGIHHPNLGLFLKQRMDALKVECVLRHKDEGGNVVAAQMEFLLRHFRSAPSSAVPRP
jgi:acetyl esterase